MSGIKKHSPDVIALQEVNQTQGAKTIRDAKIYNYIRCQSSVIKEDNFAYEISKELQNYFWTWLPIKKSYDKFDEGLSFFTKKPIEQTDCILLSKTNDYNNWRKRMALGIKISDFWLYNVHMGWYNDTEEPFLNQWKKLNESLQQKGQVFLLGDFNVDYKTEGYDLICKDMWFDTYILAEEKDDGTTVVGEIDGWKNHNESKRIDYIFSKNEIEVKSSYTIFNGDNEDIVSDHRGIIITI